METSFGRLIVLLSQHFDMDECRKLCHYFDLPPATQSSILEGKSPGLSLLEHLEKRDVINPGDISKLENALKELKFDDAVVKKIEEYHRTVGRVNNEIYYELDSDPDSEDGNNANSETKETFEDFLVKVGLDGRLTNKLYLDEFVIITDPSSPTSNTYPQLFWQKITSFDYRACLSDPSAKDRFSVRDFIYAMLLCSDNFLRQDIISKMSSCQMAVPALLPSLANGKVQFLIWALRGIVKQRGTDLEQYIVYHPAFTVSVLRIGNVRLSKSNLLNILTGRCQGNTSHAHFLSRSDDFVTPSFSQGCLEAMWYLPTNTKKEMLKEVITFLNLRGDCTNHELQATFACHAANLVIAFVSKENIKKYNDMFGKIKAWSKEVMFVAIKEEDALSPDNAVRRIRQKGQWYFVNTLQLDVLSHFISNKVAEYLETCSPSDRRKFLDNIQLCSSLNIEVDQEQKSCQDAETVLEQVLCHIRGQDLGEFKHRTFSLQKYWYDWVEIDKTSPKIDPDKDQSLEHVREKLLSKKLVQRKQQLAQGLSDHMKLFRHALQEFWHNKEHKKETLQYFMFSFQQILKQKSDTGIWPHIQKIIKLREKLQAVGNSSSSTTKLDEQMKKERTDEFHLSQRLKLSCQKESQFCQEKNLGLEHFIRELGQYYEAIIECQDSTYVDADAVFLPEIAAYLLNQGIALEIMDGDTGRVPITWVTHVFREVVELLNDETIFVLGIIGVQSSGKSTLLNSMFGVSFPVRAGRCTSGVFVRMLQVAEDFSRKLGFRYIFVIDSEGLCSPERAQSDVLEQLFDNQLATFVLSITDVTILNFEGENISPNMRGVLQIATYAQMRMKKAKLKTQCRITQQKVGQPDAPLRNKANLTQILAMLDNATLAASQAEGFGDQFKEFSDIFYLHLDDKTQYIPSLWNGIMVPPNHLYSEAVVTLKNAILNDFICNTLQPQFKISDFILRIENVWEGVKEETFVFNFQDTFKAIVFHQLSIKYTMLISEMRLHMIKCRQKWQLLIDDSTQNLSEVYKIIQKQVTAEFRAQLEIIVEKLEVSIEMNSKQNSSRVFHNRFLEYAKFDVKEAEMHMSFAIQNDIKAKERQNEIQKTVSKWRQKLQEKAFALKNREIKYSLLELLKVFQAQWEELMESVRDKFSLEKVEGNTIANTFIDKLLKITSGMSVEKEICSLLKEEGGIETHKENIVWSEYFLEQLSNEDKKIKEELISEMVSQVLFELKQQCQSRRKFDQNLVHFTLQNALHKLSSYETESSLENEDVPLEGNKFRLPNAIVAKALLHICGEGHTIIQENHQKYEEEFSCDRLFKEQMDNLRSDFIAFYESKFQDARAVSFVCSILLEITTKFMVGLLNVAFRDILFHKLKQSNKCMIVADILNDIATHDDATKYLNFIADSSSFIESWLYERCKSICIENETHQFVNDLVERKLCSMVVDIMLALNIAHSSEIKCRANDSFKPFSQWIAVFEREFENKTGLKCHLPDLRQFQISSINDFTERLTEFVGGKLKQKVLERIQLPEPSDSEGIDIFFTLVLDDPVREVARAFTGCRKQCPLCGSPCDQPPSVFHRHAATAHYPLGISGKRNARSSRLAVDFCSYSLVLQNFSYKVPGRKEIHDTASFEKEYPDWQINPSGITYQGEYWRWVFAKYNNDFASHYHCKQANLPKSWTSISDQTALLSLNYEMYFSIRRHMMTQRVIIQQGT